MSIARFSEMPSSHPQGRRILVVEDDVLLRLMVADELREKGFTVLEAANCEEAISVLRSALELDLVFTDLQLSGQLDGLDLARFVSENRPGMTIVLTSAHLPGKSLPQGVVDFFQKPYDFRAVIDRIEELASSDTRDA